VLGGLGVWLLEILQQRNIPTFQNKKIIKETRKRSDGRHSQPPNRVAAAGNVECQLVQPKRAEAHMGGQAYDVIEGGSNVASSLKREDGEYWPSMSY